ncbi:MAG: response regulator transcription factor [Candidatus Levybacteria bacterium]|nr:response regulator transcription factor [Candidatus Levybacteria bacterium]
MKKVIIIDDDENILEALKILLEHFGFKAETLIRDGERLAKAINKQIPDLIILDVLLSGEDGRVVCKTLKSTKKTKDIPVIMISAHPNAKQKALEMGADEFIAKPFDVEHLLDKVEYYTETKLINN